MTDSSSYLLDLFVASNEAFNGQHWRQGPAPISVPPTTIAQCTDVLQRQLLHLRKVLEVAGFVQMKIDNNDTTTSTTTSSYSITYLLDIEGTTTPLPFVTRVLFPFAESQLESWVSTTLSVKEGGSSSAEEVVLLKQCIEEAQKDPLNTVLFEGNGDVGAAFVAACKARMVENSKVGYLKKVQGYLWRSAYETGKIKGHVLPDAVDAIRTWSSPSSSSTVQIYSSGSIPAQKLLFGYSSAGDLTPYLTGYYDPSTVGGKAEASSYTNIRKAVQQQPPTSRIIFITDSLLEVEAAVASKDIDLIIFSLRPMNAPDLDVKRLAELGIPVVSSFSIITAAMNGDGALSKNNINDDEVVETLWSEVQQYRDVGSNGTTPLKIFS